MAPTARVHIRQAVVGDLDALTPLFDAYRVFYGKPSDPALARSFLHERLAHRQSVVFLAQSEEGAVIGFTQLYPSFSSVSAAPIYILNDLYVSPTARRCGAAAQLLDAAAAFGKSVGAVRLSLSTATTNHPAQALYAAHGWVRDDVFWHYQLALPSA